MKERTKLGRPPLSVDRRRGCVLSVRLSGRERIDVEVAAQKSGLTTSRWIRAVLMWKARSP